jgi:hypothetical protein
MKLPRFLSIKKIEKLSKQDEKVFTEASELALLRLKQCVADVRMPALTMRNAVRPLGTAYAKKTHEPFPGSFPESPDGQCLPTPVVNSCPMGTKTIVSSLRASSGRPMRVAFSDGVVQTVIIGTIDDEGFLHRDLDGADPQVFWTRFEHVNALEAETSSSCVEYQ